MTGLMGGEARGPVTTSLTRPDRGEAMERLVATVQGLPSEDQAPYLLIVCGFLAGNAPDVLTFLMDRADQVMAS